MPDAQFGANKYWSKGYTANLVPTDEQSLALRALCARCRTLCTARLTPPPASSSQR